MPSVSTNTKIECLNEAIKLVKKQYGKNLEPCCPHESLVRKHLRAISGYLNELELFFQDTDDTFAGHFLYAAIEDSKVKEITLMG